MMHPSESVVRRKPGNSYSAAAAGIGAAHGMQEGREPPQHYAPSSSSDDDPLVSAEPAFRYSTVLMAALTPPVLIMLAFGGRPALLVVCFGTLVSYIFDLLGAMEATLVTILVTLMALWGSLLYAARYLLQRSFLANIPLLVSFALVLVWVFVVLAGDFRAVRNEFDTGLLHAEAWLFATMPVICAALVTWCLCVELPSMEFPLCFALVYCGYLALMGGPRRSSLGGAVAADPRAGWSFILSERNLLVLYATPCVVSPLLYIIVHRNVLMNLGPRMQGLLLAVAVPAVLVLSVAERHVGYWPPDRQDGILSMLEMWKLGMLFVGIFGVKDHHFFDDLKVFSSYNLLPEAMMTPAVAFTFLFMSVALYQYQRVKKSSREVDNTYSFSTGASSVLFNHPMLSVCVAGSALGIGLIVGVTLSVLPLFVVGVLALSEYYLATSCGLMHGHELLGVALVAVGAFPVAMVSSTFTDVTLKFLSFGFSGAFGVTIGIQTFCTYCTLFTVAAVVLPTLLAGGGSPAKKDASLGFMPGSGRESMSLFWSSAAGVVFSVGSVVFASFASFLELVVREQDWSAVSPSVEFIYPTWLFVLTGVLLVSASYHIYTLGVMDITAVMCVVVVEGCKCLHLIGVGSSDIATAFALLLVLLFPFFAKASQLAEGSAADIGGVESMSDIVQLLLYSMVVVWPLLWARETVLDSALQLLLRHPPSDLQSWCACLAVFTGFITCGLLVFWKSASFLRSIFSIVFVGSVLIASEALGPVSITIDPTSSTYVVVSADPLLADQHAGLFLIICILLLLGAGVGILPLRRPLPRYVFLTTFTYCGSVAVHAWAFPEYLGEVAADTGTFELPKLLCLLCVFCGSFVSVHCSIASPISGLSRTLVGAFFFALTVLPFVAVVWTVLDGSLSRHLMGILYVASFSCAICAAVIRMSEVLNEQPGGRPKGHMAAAGGESMEVFRTVVTVTAAVLALVFGIFACVANSDFDADFAVPIVTLVLLCVKRGIFLDSAHPIVTSVLASSFWWIVSAIYHIFIRGVAEGKFNVDGYDTRQTVFLPDADVSVWTCEPAWFAYLHIVLSILPLPVIFMSTLRQNRNDSEDVIFALAVVSLLSGVAAQVWSIRFLGIIGLALGMWRCSFIGQAQKMSDRLI